jgi:hypothetical protein
VCLAVDAVQRSPQKTDVQAHPVVFTWNTAIQKDLIAEWIDNVKEVVRFNLLCNGHCQLEHGEDASGLETVEHSRYYGEEKCMTQIKVRQFLIMGSSDPERN